jgi:hypothetical protein
LDFGFWILDFGFWIVTIYSCGGAFSPRKALNEINPKSKIQNPKSFDRTDSGNTIRFLWALQKFATEGFGNLQV